METEIIIPLEYGITTTYENDGSGRKRKKIVITSKKILFAGWAHLLHFRSNLKITEHIKISKDGRDENGVQHYIAQGPLGEMTPLMKECLSIQREEA